MVNLEERFMIRDMYRKGMSISAITSQIFLDSDAQALELYADNGIVRLLSLQIYPLSPGLAGTEK